MNNKNTIHKICIFTQSPLSGAPRVVKEANAYAQHGYNVTVYALWITPQGVENDKTLIDSRIQFKPGIDLRTNGLKTKCIRLQRRFGRELVKYFKVETLASLGYDFKNYYKKINAEQADLYIGHEEMSMALAKKLIENKKQVAFDFEDWHSKDLLPKDRIYRPITLLENLEAFLLKNTSYCYTTSDAMGEAMASYYNTKVPCTIYNAFPSKARMQMDGLHKDIKDKSTFSLYWFSQVISEGRGLELLFEALPYTKTNFQLHLRGVITEEYKSIVENSMPENVSLFIHELVPMGELISRIAEHDLGIAFEETTPESRNYTITNKVFHYLQSGIAILATETAGQLEVLEKTKGAGIISDRNPIALAQLIDEIVSENNQLERMKGCSWLAGETLFSFEKQEEKLLQFLDSE
ncbi:hypothetical protein ACFFVB_15700 [Formosa undariae]|uniref:Glycosyltransferase family 4 protein n=1 Tax=Formosa undariae TaxID=1325436 RepID=A0ABV5F511_9FLAO